MLPITADERREILRSLNNLLVQQQALRKRIRTLEVISSAVVTFLALSLLVRLF